MARTSTKRGKPKATRKPSAVKTKRPVKEEVASVLEWLERKGSKRNRDGMARYAWAICDSMCFHLFDRTPHAWDMVDRWSDRREEFVKRSAYALLASLSVHDKQAADKLYTRGLVRIERAATDDRNFVMKAVNWALRSIGKRNQTLNTAAVAVARRLAESPQSAPRWVGKNALRELTSEGVSKRLASREAKSRAAR